MALQLTKAQFDQSKACEEAAAAGIPWVTIIQWIIAVGVPAVVKVVIPAVSYIRGGGSVADALLWGEAAVMALASGQPVPSGPPLHGAPATKMTP